MYKNFIDDFFSEGLLIDDIDDYVEFWHNHDSNDTLREFLGLTEYEYEVWMQEGNDVVRDILYCRRHNITLEDYSKMSKGEKIAARSYSLSEVKKFKEDGE